MLDPLNILLLAIALIVFWRLRSVLGTRTGTEKPRLTPIERRNTDVTANQDSDTTIIDIPRKPSSSDLESGTEGSQRDWSGFAEPGTQLATSLSDIASEDPAFNPAAFLDGAKLAYEAIVEAFAKGDKSALKTLLSKDVLDDFARVIERREMAGHRVDMNFVGIERARILSAKLEGRNAFITVEFISELITATYDKSGQLIDGNPKQISRVTDVWTFERDVTSRNPNWKLVATQAPE